MSLAGSVDFLLLFEENSGWSASRAQKIYRDSVLSETKCRGWFCHFKDGDFEVYNRPGKRKPKTFKDADLEALFELNHLWEFNCCVWVEYSLKNVKQGLETVIQQYDNFWLLIAKPNPLKGTWKRSNGKFYPIRHIPQILHPPIITYSVR